MPSLLPSDLRPVPSLKSLFAQDFIFGRAVRTGVFLVVVAVGVRWATEPSRAAVTPVDLSMEKALGDWIPPIALTLAALGPVIAVSRYRWVKKVFTEGITVKATVEDLEVYSWSPGTIEGSSVKKASRHAYYVKLRYAVHGVERTIERKLPNSGYTYGLVKGQETELMVLDSSPDRPLIRSVYLGKR